MALVLQKKVASKAKFLLKKLGFLGAKAPIAWKRLQMEYLGNFSKSQVYRGQVINGPKASTFCIGDIL